MNHVTWISSPVSALAQWKLPGLFHPAKHPACPEWCGHPAPSPPQSSTGPSLLRSKAGTPASTTPTPLPYPQDPFSTQCQCPLDFKSKTPPLKSENPQVEGRRAISQPDPSAAVMVRIDGNRCVWPLCYVLKPGITKLGEEGRRIEI